MALKPGCFLVCRPKRSTSRRYSLSDLRRILGYLREDYDDELICDAISEVMKCSPEIDCGELVQDVDAAIQNLPERESLVQFVRDLFDSRLPGDGLPPLSPPGRGRRIPEPGRGGNLLTRLRWIWWLFRAYSLLKELSNVLDWIDVTKYILGEVYDLLRKVCEGEEGASVRGARSPAVCGQVTVAAETTGGCCFGGPGPEGRALAILAVEPAVSGITEQTLERGSVDEEKR